MELKITIVEGKDLPPFEKDGSGDPYVHICYEGEEKNNTSTI